MFSSLVIMACCASVSTDGAENGIRVDSVQVTLIDQADISARDTGLVKQVLVREGQLVKKGDLLVQLDDTESLLALDRARLELDIARRMASNDVKVRFAEKSLEVAKAESRRAAEAGEKFRKSVSETELDQLRLVAERSALEIEQAKYDLTVAALTAKVKENDVQTAQAALARRAILSPLDGVVEHIKRHPGETVQQNETLVRVLRLDRLRAEGFVPHKLLHDGLVGAPVQLTVDLADHPKAAFAGRLVYISPEVNPVSGQARVWAEIDNRESLLRPGLTGSMTIGAGEPDASSKRR